MSYNYDWKMLNNILIKNGSWLYDACFVAGKIDFRALFDPNSDEFKRMTIKQKMLTLRELFYCGIKPMTLNQMYKTFCVEAYNNYYYSFPEALLEIISILSADDLVSLDIHDPQNWCSRNRKNSITQESHELIVSTLEGMNYSLLAQLIKTKDLIMRKRLIYFNNIINNKNNLNIVPNQNPILDQVDEELLRRVETFEPNVILRFGNIRMLAENIYDEIDAEHKKKRIALDELFCNAIKYRDFETLKDFPIIHGTDSNNTISIKEYHEVIVSSLEIMSSDLHSKLKNTTDLLIRKRLIHFNDIDNLIVLPIKNRLIYFNSNNNLLVVPNQNPILDQVDDELLRRVESIEPDVKLRYGRIRLLAEDIYDKIEPDHKKERIALAELLYKSIESMDIETLKGLQIYRNSNIEHFIDIKKDPKKWLYSCVWGFSLKRDLCRIRGVEFTM